MAKNWAGGTLVRGATNEASVQPVHEREHLRRCVDLDMANGGNAAAAYRATHPHGRSGNAVMTKRERQELWAQFAADDTAPMRVRRQAAKLLVRSGGGALLPENCRHLLVARSVATAEQRGNRRQRQAGRRAICDTVPLKGARIFVASSDKALKERRRRFVEAYMTHGNATQAAIDAGYSRKTAKQAGSRLLTFGDVRAGIRERVQADPRIATREERQRMLTDMMYGAGDFEGATIQERREAINLLGKSQGDFVEQQEIRSDVVYHLQWNDEDDEPAGPQEEPSKRLRSPHRRSGT